MKKYLFAFFFAARVVAPRFSRRDAALKDERDKVSYSIGLDIGTTFKKQGMDINPDVCSRGLKDGDERREAIDDGRANARKR